MVPFEQSPYVTVLLDLDGKVVEANAEAEAFFERPSGELKGRAVWKLPGVVAQMHVADWYRAAVAQAAKGATVRGDVEYAKADGTASTLEWTVLPLRGGDTRTTGLVAEGRDVTSDRRAARHAHLLSTLALAIADTDSLELAIAATLRTVCEATGWVLGEAWLPRAAPGGGQRLERGGVWTGRDRKLATFAAQGQGFCFLPGEGLPGVAWQDRRPVWARQLADQRDFTRGALAAAAGIRAGVAIPIVVDDQVVAVLSFYMVDPRQADEQLVDLTTAVAAQLGALVRRKEAEEAHRVAEAQLAGMIAISVDAIISCDESRRITLFNWGAEQIFGYTAAEVLGQSR